MSETNEESTQVTETAPPTLEDSLREALKAADTEKKTEVAAPAPASETTSGNTEIKTPVETKSSGEQTPDSREPPEHWSDADKTAFKALPTEGQDFLLRREKETTADYTKKTQDIAETRKFREDLEPVFKNNAQQLQMMGASPAQAVELMFNVQRALLTDPANAFKALANSFNFDLKTLLPDAKDDKFTDPEVETLKKQIQDLNGKVNMTLQTSQASQEAQVKSTIESFRNEKDATGNPKYPYFDKVQGDMASIISVARQSGKPIDLATAYDKAIRLDDELYTQTLKARDAAAIKAREEEARLQAEKAKKAGEANIKGRNTPTMPKTPVTIEDNLRAAMNQR
jgi:hypothetical protein